jgi:hypothetical protein
MHTKLQKPVQSWFCEPWYIAEFSCYLEFEDSISSFSVQFTYFWQMWQELLQQANS